jgi:hypothetical protein
MLKVPVIMLTAAALFAAMVIPETADAASKRRVHRVHPRVYVGPAPQPYYGMPATYVPAPPFPFFLIPGPWWIPAH